MSLDKEHPNDVPKPLQRYKDNLFRPLDEVQKERIWHGIEAALQHQHAMRRSKTQRLKRVPAILTSAAAILVAASSVLTASDASHSNQTKTLSPSHIANTVYPDNPSTGLAPLSSLPARGQTEVGPFGKPTLTKVSLRHIDTSMANSAVPQSFVSTDGAYLTFCENGQDGIATYVEDMTGAVTKVTNGLFALYGSTPDGNLLFGAAAGGRAMSFEYQPKEGIVKTFADGGNGTETTLQTEKSIGGHWAASILAASNGGSTGHSPAVLAVDGKPENSLSTGGPLTFKWSPDGIHLAVVMGVSPTSTKLNVVDALTGQAKSVDGTFSFSLTQMYNSLSGAPTAPWKVLDWSGDGHYLAIHEDGMLMIYDMQSSDQSRAPYSLPLGTSDWGFDSDNELYAVSPQQNGDALVTFYRIENHSLVQAPKHWSIPGKVIAEHTLMDGRVIIQTNAGRFDVVTSDDRATVPSQPSIWWYDSQDGAIYYVSAESAGAKSRPVWRIQLAPVVLAGGHTFQ